MEKAKTIFLVLLALMFIPALLMMFLSQVPMEVWQDSFFQYITQRLHVRTGMLGELPFYTVSVTACFSFFSSIWACFIFWLLLKDKRTVIPKLSQFKLWDAVIITGLPISFIIFCFSMMRWHFSILDMTARFGRNSYLFQTMYQNKFGIILGELFFMLFLIAMQLMVMLGVFSMYQTIKDRGVNANKRQ